MALRGFLIGTSSMVPSGTFRPENTPSFRPFRRFLLAAEQPFWPTNTVATINAGKRLSLNAFRFMVGRFFLLSFWVLLVSRVDILFDFIDQVKRETSGLFTECSSDDGAC